MRQRAWTLVLAALVAALDAGSAGASDESAGPGLRLNAWGLGLRLEFDPRALESRFTAPRHEPYRSTPFAVHAPAQGLRFSAAGSSPKEGWQAFGAVGPMRWSRELEDDAELRLRFGGRPAGTPRLPGKLNVGIQYRF